MAAIPQHYFDKVKAFYHGDINLTWKWFKSPHPNLGMMSPLDAIRGGRKNKVLQLIDERKLFIR